MRNAILVKVLESLSYLLEKSAACLLWYNFVGNMHFHEVVHTYTMHIVRNDADLLGSFN